MTQITVGEWLAELNRTVTPAPSLPPRPIAKGSVYRLKNSTLYRWTYHDNGAKRTISLRTSDRVEAEQLASKFRAWLNKRNGTIPRHTNSRGLGPMSVARAKYLALLALQGSDAGAMTANEVRDKIHAQRETVSIALKELHHDGHVRISGLGVRHSPFRYAANL